MLEVSGVKTRYGISQVLFGVNLEVARSEVVSLLGRNGMGKTTTIHSIMGVVPAFDGSIRFDGREIRGLPSYLVSRLGLGLVPEGRQIFPNLSVRENLVATAGKGRGECRWTLESVLEMFPELTSRMSIMGNLLSGGEQQMLAIGRALLTNPELLILDEATEGLAPLIRAKIWKCLHRIKESGQSILVVDKNIRDLVAIADRHFILEKGQIVWSGDSEELTANRQELERFLGV
ncbi:MAG: ABC transporter ATP-binding protein [Proteobacteria bacterium]|nr:MAG: ABC transporter ATP-binding protein [Pseudomonadota bacterium]